MKDRLNDRLNDDLNRARAQRDELVAVLTELLAAVDQLTLDDPTHYVVATAVGLPALRARQVLEGIGRSA